MRDLVEVVREDPGGTGALRAVHDGDGLVRKLAVWIQALDGGVVPVHDLAREDLSQHTWGQLEPTGLHPLDVDDGHDTSHDHRELHEPGVHQVRGLHRRVGAAEIDSARLDLADAATRPDALVVDLHAVQLVVLRHPESVDRLREGRPRAVDRRRAAGRDDGRRQDCR